MRRSVSRRLAFVSTSGLIASIAIIVSCTGDDPPFVDANKTSDAGTGTGTDGNVVGPNDANNGQVDARVNPDDAGTGDAEGGTPPAPPASPFFIQFQQSKLSAAGGPFIRRDRLNNTYIAFTFKGDTTVAGKLLSSSGDADVALVKLNPDGSAAWAQHFGFTGQDVVHGLAIDSSGDGPVYIVGETQSATMKFGKITLPKMSAAGESDPFVASFDTKDGNPLSAFDYVTQSASSGSCNSIDVAKGNVIVGCTITGPASLPKAGGTLELPSIGDGPNAVLARLDADLIATWANAIGGAGTDGANAVAITSDGLDFYAALSSTSSTLGDTKNTIQTTTTTATDNDDIVRLASNGGVAWVDAFPALASGSVHVHTLRATSTGLTFAGEISGSVDFQTEAAPLKVTSTSANNDLVVGSLTTAGKVVWVRHFGGSTANTGTVTVALDGTNTFTAGQTETATTIDGVSLFAPTSDERVAFLTQVLHADAGADAGAPFVRWLEPASDAGPLWKTYSSGLDVTSDFVVWAGAYNDPTSFGDAGLVPSPVTSGFDAFVLGFKR